MTLVKIKLAVNGERIEAEIEPRLNLADFLRQRLELTGTHVGCEHGVCGACTIRLNGDIARSCITLAVQADGANVETIEGLVTSEELKNLQDEFYKKNALQCGFCTPGMLITAAELLKKNPKPTRNQIREYLSGNYCRCTGYHSIVDAIEAVSLTRGSNDV
ncbi:MAG: (2Fe-2S)-binding protein [Candidatus Cloacimonetes bacterium]|nr:(2Fe-2S)-binding protein [Candidatus Cloacimonadota bacterium]MCK9515592.1 (2Fe-2S)-binding protein [Ottowia sp.]